MSQNSFHTLLLVIALLMAAIQFVKIRRQRHPWSLSILGFWFLIAAYAVAGNVLWLVCAAVSLMVALLRYGPHMKATGAPSSTTPAPNPALADIPAAGASKEEQENFRKTLSLEEKTVLMTAMLSSTSKWDWSAERQKIITMRRLRPLTPVEEKERNSMEFSERVVLLNRELMAGNRLSPAAYRMIIDNLKRGEAEKKAIADNLKRKEEAAAATLMREMKINSVASQLPVRFCVERPLPLRVQDGKSAVVEVGEYEGSISLSVTDPDEKDDWQESEVVCQFRFRQPGREWRSESKLWLAGLMDLEDTSFSKSAILWSDAPPNWKAAFAKRCIAAATHVSDDSRSRFSLKLGGQEFTIMLKYCHWRADLALTEDGRNLLVRIYELFAEARTEKAGGKTSQPEDNGQVPPFCVRLPVEKLLPLTALRVHAPLDAEEWGEDELVEFIPVTGA